MTSRWEQMAGCDFDAADTVGRHIWISDGTLGFARPLVDGETPEQAQADFCRAYERQEGESDEEFEGRIVDEVRVVIDGERVI